MLIVPPDDRLTPEVCGVPLKYAKGYTFTAAVDEVCELHIDMFVEWVPPIADAIAPENIYFRLDSWEQRGRDVLRASLDAADNRAAMGVLASRHVASIDRRW